MARIREVELEDLEAIKLIEKECFTKPWDELILKAELFLYRNSYYFIIEEEEIIGYGGFSLEGDIRHITSIAIRPKYQNKGFGKTLLKHLMSDKTYLEVSVNNKKAITLYESLGFKKKFYLKDYYEEEDAYRMEKGESK